MQTLCSSHAVGFPSELIGRDLSGWEFWGISVQSDTTSMESS